MKTSFKNGFLLVVLMIPIFVQARNTIKLQKSTMTYPETRKENTTDNYFGTTVADPYRWLEDDRSAATREWVIAQNKVTQDYLSKIPFRDAIKQRLKKLMKYEKYSEPFKEGGYTYFYKNTGLQNQSVLYRQKEGAEAE